MKINSVKLMEKGDEGTWGGEVEGESERLINITRDEIYKVRYYYIII